MELAIVTLATVRPDDSGTAFEQKNKFLWTCLGVNPLDMPRSTYWTSEGKHTQKPTMPYHPTLTS